MILIIVMKERQRQLDKKKLIKEIWDFIQIVGHISCYVSKYVEIIINGRTLLKV